MGHAGITKALLGAMLYEPHATSSAPALSDQEVVMKQYSCDRCQSYNSQVYINAC
jgi:hypothetical protein